MNIKHSQDYQLGVAFKSKPKIKHSNSCRACVKSPTNQKLDGKTTTDQLNSSNKQSNVIRQVKVSLCIKRQNTQKSQTMNQVNKVNKQKNNLKAQNGQYLIQKFTKQLSGKKLNSDQQSTNVFGYNKQSPYPESNQWHMNISNTFSKEKSIQPSRDLNIRLMCNKGENGPQFCQKIEVMLPHLTKLSPLKSNLKQKITKKLRSFESLSKIFQQQNEYFVKNLGISGEEKKRLQKMQLLELKILKKQIFELKQKIETKTNKVK